MSGIAWAAVAAALAQAGAGIFGSQQAAGAQEDASKRAAELSRRGTETSLLMQEPSRYLGYQALSDIGRLYGWDMAPYTDASSLLTRQTNLNTKTIAKFLRAGYSIEDIAKFGTLGGIGAKDAKRLSAYGLTPADILLLQGKSGTATGAGLAGGGGATGTGQPGDMSRFFTSPDYNFRFNEGGRAVTQSGAVGRPGLFSGDTLKALDTFGSNIASGEYGNYVNRLLQVAGLGTAATNTATNAVQSGTNTQAQLAQNVGDARASGVLGATNSIGNAIGNAAQWYLLSKYLNPGGAGNGDYAGNGNYVPLDVNNPALYQLYQGQPLKW